MVGKHNHGVLAHLGIAARHNDVHHIAALVVRQREPYDAVAERADFWRVARPNAELSRLGNEHQMMHLALEQELVGTHELALHYSFAALARTSSMLPA